MRSFAIEEPGSPVPALYATLSARKVFFCVKMESVAGDLDWDFDDFLAEEGREQKKILDGN